VLPSQIASIVSTVSGLAATVSLIYLGIQIRLSVRHTRASIQQGTAARTTSILSLRGSTVNQRLGDLSQNHMVSPEIGRQGYPARI